MKQNMVKAKLQQGQSVYGLLTPVADPIVVEILALLGYDCYMLDCEHGPLGPSQAESFVRTCEAAGITPLARVRSADPKLVLQFLDVGIMGVMLPGVRNAGDVEQLVEAVRYPPVGRRGMAPVRANDYLMGSMPAQEYIQYANDQILIFPQIELVEAVESLDTLLKVEGVDGYFVGPRDLSLSMGYTDGPNHPEVQEVINNVFTRTHEAGLFSGTVAFTGPDANALTKKGVGLLLTSINALLKLGTDSYLGGAKA
ncbi:MAG: aldolase/citrate lyase family protein [Chloroflexia bacterium]